MSTPFILDTATDELLVLVVEFRNGALNAVLRADKLGKASAYDFNGLGFGFEGLFPMICIEFVAPGLLNSLGPYDFEDFGEIIFFAGGSD
jgi:hypothetical protein